MMSLDRSSDPAVPSDPRADAIRDLCRCCDLAERLPLLPPSAKSRGVYLVGIDRVLAKAGSFDKFKALFPKRPSAIPWYPRATSSCALRLRAPCWRGPNESTRGCSRSDAGTR